MSFNPTAWIDQRLENVAAAAAKAAVDSMGAIVTAEINKIPEEVDRIVNLAFAQVTNEFGVIETDAKSVANEVVSQLKSVLNPLGGFFNPPGGR